MRPPTENGHRAYIDIGIATWHILPYRAVPQPVRSHCAVLVTNHNLRFQYARPVILCIPAYIGTRPSLCHCWIGYLPRSRFGWDTSDSPRAVFRHRSQRRSVGAWERGQEPMQHQLSCICMFCLAYSEGTRIAPGCPTRRSASTAIRRHTEVSVGI